MNLIGPRARARVGAGAGLGIGIVAISFPLVDDPTPAWWRGCLAFFLLLEDIL